MDMAIELRDLAIQVNAIMRTISSNNGLTLPQANILSSIPAMGISLIDLSNKLGLDISTMSRNIKKLTNMNLIIKERNSSDLREYVILFTDNGEHVINKINDDFSNLLRSIPVFSENSKMTEFVEKMNWALIKSRNVI